MHIRESLVMQLTVRAVDGVEDSSDDTWEDPRGRGRRGRGQGREGGMGRRGPPGQQEEEKEYAVSFWLIALATTAY